MKSEWVVLEVVSRVLTGCNLENWQVSNIRITPHGHRITVWKTILQLQQEKPDSSTRQDGSKGRLNTADHIANLLIQIRNSFKEEGHRTAGCKNTNEIHTVNSLWITLQF